MTYSDRQHIARTIKHALDVTERLGTVFDTVRPEGKEATDYAVNVLRGLTMRFADGFEIDHPKFNKSEFIATCGFGPSN